MSSSLDIQAMITQAKSSRESQEALLGLYRAYLRFLARVQLRGKLELKSDASDLAQEALLQAHIAFGQFRGTTEKELLAWLRKILQNCLLQIVRMHNTAKRDYRLERHITSSVDASVAGLSKIATRMDTPSQQVARRESEVLLANALEKLSADHRHVITLHHVEGLKFAEVAERMQRTPAAVQRLWMRALKKLRETLREP